jgi:hypothetical protein
MGAEAAAAGAKITARFNHVEIGCRKRSLFIEKNRMAKFPTFILFSRRAA